MKNNNSINSNSINSKMKNKFSNINDMKKEIEKLNLEYISVNKDDLTLKRKIDKLNIKLCLETDKYLRIKSQNKLTQIEQNQEKLINLLFSQISLYIDELDRINFKNSNNGADSLSNNNSTTIIFNLNKELQIMKKSNNLMKNINTTLEKRIKALKEKIYNQSKEVDSLKRQNVFYKDQIKYLLMNKKLAETKYNSLSKKLNRSSKDYNNRIDNFRRNNTTNNNFYRSLTNHSSKFSVNSENPSHKSFLKSFSKNNNNNKRIGLYSKSITKQVINCDYSLNSISNTHKTQNREYIGHRKNPSHYSKSMLNDLDDDILLTNCSFINDIDKYSVSKNLNNDKNFFCNSNNICKINNSIDNLMINELNINNFEFKDKNNVKSTIKLRQKLNDNNIKEFLIGYNDSIENELKWLNEIIQTVGGDTDIDTNLDDQLYATLTTYQPQTASVQTTKNLKKSLLYNKPQREINKSNGFKIEYDLGDTFTSRIVNKTENNQKTKNLNGNKKGNIVLPSYSSFKKDFKFKTKLN